MNPSLLWLGAALFTWGIGEGMFYMFQPIYLQQLGADPIQIGVILGALGLVMTLAHIPAGYLSDRIGRRPILIAAWGIGVAATLIMVFATNLIVFIAGALVYRFTVFAISPLDSYVTAARGSWSVGRAITFISLTFNAGAVLGPIAGGWVGDQYSLRMVYWLAVGVFSISAISVWFISPQPRHLGSLENPPGGLLTNWRYLGFLSIFLAVTFAAYLPQPLTKAPENIAMARELADALHAELAASRPICDAGWLPMERQVGSSGQTVAPKLYLALGISGASQHVVGMKGARTIVAINKDAEAPIFELADYGITGDLFEVVPQIIQALKA